MKAVDRAQRQILREKLSGFELFKELPNPLKEELVTVVDQVSYAQGSVLFHEGDPPEDTYLILEGEVRVYNKAADNEKDDASPRRSIIRRPSANSAEESELGQCVNVIPAGRSLGMIEVMQEIPRSATAACSLECEMVVIRKPDFLRLVKDPMSRDWVEKDEFLQVHLVGIREHARTFVPITGKSHATYMFVKRKYAGGHPFLREGTHTEAALYVVFSGSVEFYCPHPAEGVSPSRANLSWKNPVMEQRKPLGLLQPSCAGVLAREYRLCSMLPGGIFSSVGAAGASNPEPFTVVAGPKGCEVFESVGDNFQKLPSKVAALARDLLAKVAQLHQDRCQVLLATMRDTGNDDNPAKMWSRVKEMNEKGAKKAPSPLATSSRMQARF
ncbi:unnamed protein product [Effrenium voratum]|nr:unnamed protein product [Effrenium voratum]